jgi:hypothetical protein
MCLVLSAFTPRPITLVAATKACVFCLQNVHFLPIYSHQPHKPEADVYHLVSNQPGLPAPS